MPFRAGRAESRIGGAEHGRGTLGLHKHVFLAALSVSVAESTTGSGEADALLAQFDWVSSRLARVWVTVRDSLWFVPTVCTIAASCAALLLLYLESTGLWRVDPTLGLVYGGGAESARSLLSAVAGGLITVTGVAFSVTIVALELSSSQYTPRVLPNFVADRANQLVIGTLIGTFTYSLLVLRVIDSGGPGDPPFVPHIAVTGGMVLALLSVAALIFFINHAARSIQVTWILQTAVEHALEQVERLFPEDFGKEDPALSAEEEPPADALVIRAPRSGYLQTIDAHVMFETGRSAEAIIKVERTIGSFVLEGEPLAFAWPAASIGEEERTKVSRAFALGSERTREQDFELTLIEISDIAVRALSPGINDPTTAQHCIDRLAELLLALGRRRAPTRIRTREGRLHVIVEELTFARAVDTAFAPILRFGASNSAVRERILARLDSLLALVPAGRRAPLLELRASVRDESGGGGSRHAGGSAS